MKPKRVTLARGGVFVDLPMPHCSALVQDDPELEARESSGSVPTGGVRFCGLVLRRDGDFSVVSSGGLMACVKTSLLRRHLREEEGFGWKNDEPAEDEWENGENGGRSAATTGNGDGDGQCEKEGEKGEDSVIFDVAFVGVP